LLDLLAKAFVVRRLRISAQYARSSLLGLRKNLLRNRRQSYCIVTAEGCGPSVLLIAVFHTSATRF